MGCDLRFTAVETKQIERLRKREQQWRWARWLYLAIGGMMAIGIVLYGCRLWRLFNIGDANGWPSPIVLEIAVLWPAFVIKLAVGGYFTISALTKWHGDPNRMLLLRLVSGEHREDNGDVR
jgi:hypothetical protein